MTRAQISFHRFSWGLIAWTLLVVLWGAFVRASNSGDGCGSHWPSCNGEVIPNPEHSKTWIEFTHRGMSGLMLLAVIALVVWAFVSFRGEALRSVRRGAAWVLGLTVSEALIGAGLVIFGLVADNDSATRAIVLAAHLVNTFLLFGALVYTTWSSRADSEEKFPKLQLKGQGWVLPIIGAVLFLTLWVSISGVVAALGDTLYPPESLQHAMAQKLSPTSSFLVRLRIVHPTMAIATAIVLVIFTALLPRVRRSSSVSSWAAAVAAVFCFQLGFGLLNVLFLAPIWMQIVHLAIADLIWIGLLMMSFCALAVGVEHAPFEQAAAQLKEDRSREREEAPAETSGTGQTIANSMKTATPPLWKDYLLLTKPRVISLLLFTTWAAMIMAQRGWPGFWLFLLTGIGFYMAAGSAHAVNMVVDRDIDQRTERTATRAVAAGRISSVNALIFAAILGIGSFLLLWWGANLLTALMAWSGLAFYVIIYTMLLKRRTWSNIVIGGAAGSFPPLVGWAAVTNELAPLAWLLFGIIFLWTPVHFWALAILIKDDYAKNGIPMLPVIRGDRATAIQIGFYTLLTIACSLAPFVLREGSAMMAGWVYLVAALILNGVLMWRSILLYQNPDRPHASSLFHYSMIYLFLLFLALALDRTFISTTIL